MCRYELSGSYTTDHGVLGRCVNFTSSDALILPYFFNVSTIECNFNIPLDANKIRLLIAS